MGCSIRRGFGYVLVRTPLVTFAGAAGTYAFECEAPGGPDHSGESLGWTAMVATTMGSRTWPETAVRRVLRLLLARRTFGVLGYVAVARPSPGS